MPLARTRILEAIANLLTLLANVAGIRVMNASPRAMIYSPAKEVIQLDYQKITAHLIGNATHDAELKLARDREHRYGDFRLAVRNRAGETTYFPVRCFGKLAAGITGIRKGTKVFVEGELEIAAFEDEAGSKRMTFRVVANTYRILADARRDVPELHALRTERSQAG